MNKSLLLLILTCLISANVYSADDPKDHPLISRFDGFKIDKRVDIQFDRYELPLGPSESSTEFGDRKLLEGKVTKISYVHRGQSKPSLLQLFKSYEKVFQDNNVEILYSCFKEECGKSNTDLVRTAVSKKRLLNEFLQFGDHAFHAARIAQGEKVIYVALYLKDERGNVAYELDFIEIDAMNTSRISMADISNGIEETGKLAFYGLYFDTGKATLKDNAKQELSLMADYLSRHTDKQYFIVGHTDNAGSYEFNLSLSLNRAKSIIEALNAQFNLDVTNLTAVGIGPVSPVAANTSDQGQAQNRRVELVAR